MAIISSHIDYSLILSGFKRVIYQNMCYLCMRIRTIKNVSLWLDTEQML